MRINFFLKKAGLLLRPAARSAAWLAASLVLTAALCAAASTEVPKPGRALIVIDTDAVLHRANPYLLGNNVQWVDKADDLWHPETGSFDAKRMDLIRQIKVPMLRFPGGSFSDVYHWKDGVGPAKGRKPGVHIFTGASQESFFGTDEFLRLSRELRAEPMITVNAVTGTAEEAAAWVRYVNVTQKMGVKYWEIGNEPYLEPTVNKDRQDPGYPEFFARRFVEFSRAMKAVDPAIRIGLPLRNNQMGRYEPGPYRDWAPRVTAIAMASADYVSMHNAYFPMIFKKEELGRPGSVKALLAAPEVVQEDLARMKAFLRKNFAGREIPIAITEYNAFFAPPQFPDFKVSASLAAALYDASVLTVFYKDRSILTANFWSLTGNAFFGALTQSGRPRPQFYMLKIFSDFVGESVLKTTVQNSPRFDSPAAGFMPAKKNVDCLTVLATRTGGTVFVILVNRSLDRDIPASILLNDFAGDVRVRASVLEGPAADADNESRETVRLRDLGAKTMADLTECVIPRHSIIAVRIEPAGSQT